MSDNFTGSGAPASAIPQSVTPATAADPSLETSEESEEGDPTQQAAPATPVEKKKNLKKLKLKVDGKEYDEEVNLDDDDYLTRQFQMAKMGSKRAQEYAQLEKEVKTFIDQLRSDPRAVLSDPSIGIDIKQLAAQIIEAEIENSKKSPEQIEKEKLQGELEAIKKERETERDAAKKKEFEILQKQEFERYDNEMTKALENHPDLPKSPYVVKKMADYLLMGLQKGMNIKPEDVVDLVRQEIKEDLKQMFAVLPEDVIEQLVGKEKISGIRKKKLAAAKAATQAPRVQDTGKTGTTKTAPGDKVSFKDFFKF